MTNESQTAIQNTIDWTLPRVRRLAGIGILLIGLIYLCLHTRYIIFDGDDAWSLSQAYNNIQHGKNENTIFSTQDDPDRLLIFHKTHHHLEGAILNVIGWTKGHAHLISTFFIFLAALLWFYILRRLKFSFDLSVIMAASMLLFPAFFGAANITRPDAMTFFLASATFLLFLRERYFWSGFLLLVSFETHVMGIMGGFYILAYVLYDWRSYFKDFKALLPIAAWFLGGMLLGLAYYIGLHWEVLSGDKFSETLLSRRSMGIEFKNYILTYFVQPLWYHHVWEFILILFSLVLFFVKKANKGHQFVWILLTVLFLSTFITGRPNRNYILYVYPAFLLILFYSVEVAGWLKSFTIVLFGIFLLHYGTVYYYQHDYHFQQMITETEAGLSEKEIPIVGMPDNWYAAKDRELYLIYNSLKNIPDLGLKELYLIRNDYLHAESLSMRLEAWLQDLGLVKDPLLAKRRRHYYELIQYFEDHYEYKLVRQIPAYGGGVVEIYHCVLKS